MAKKTTMYKWDLFIRRLRENIFRPKRQSKDILFRLVFGNDRQALLQLYNVLHGTSYTDPRELQIVTLDKYFTMEQQIHRMNMNCVCHLHSAIRM